MKSLSSFDGASRSDVQSSVWSSDVRESLDKRGHDWFKGAYPLSGPWADANISAVGILLERFTTVEVQPSSSSPTSLNLSKEYMFMFALKPKVPTYTRYDAEVNIVQVLHKWLVKGNTLTH